MDVATAPIGGRSESMHETLSARRAKQTPGTYPGVAYMTPVAQRNTVEDRFYRGPMLRPVRSSAMVSRAS